MSENSPLVLIVDDSSENVKALGEALIDECRTFFAMSGADALRQADKLRPDLILLDVMMPDMDGFKVYHCLKSIDAFRETPIIFITALDRSEDESRGLTLGAADYISKPFNPRLVQLRVRNHLELKRQRDLLKLRNKELEEAMAKIKALSGIIPICSACKKIRNDEGYWQQVEEYISNHSEAEFSHGMCSDCIKQMYPDVFDKYTQSCQES